MLRLKKDAYSTFPYAQKHQLKITELWRKKEPVYETPTKQPLMDQRGILEFGSS